MIKLYKKTKWLAGLICAIIVIGVIGVGAYLFTRPGEEPTDNIIKVRIPTLISQTGWLAEIWYADMKKGMDIAVDEINELGGIKSLNGAELELDWRDDESDDAISVTETERAIMDIESGGFVPLIIGPSTNRWRGLEITEEHNITTICISNEIEQYERGLKYTFNTTCVLPAQITNQIEYLIDYIIEPGKEPSINSWGVIWEDTASAKGMCTHTIAVMNELLPDIPKVFDESYEAGMLDFRPMILRIKAAKPDMLVLGMYYAEASALINQMWEQKCYVPLIQTQGGAAQHPDFLAATGEQSVGLVNGLWYNYDSEYGLCPTFNELHNEYYGMNGMESSGSGYHLVRTIYNALERLGPDNYMNKEAVYETVRTTNIKHSSHDPADPDANLWDVEFDEKGLNIAHEALICQLRSIPDPPYVWPSTIWPPEAASVDPIYPLPWEFE